MPVLLHFCHTQDKANLTAIWYTVAHLSNDRDHTATESD